MKTRSESDSDDDNPAPWATKDVLGFFSIVLTYAKSAQELKGAVLDAHGAKALVSFTPRVYWTTVYEDVKDKIPGSLWDIINVLACYQFGSSEDVKLDEDYCGGSVEKPEVKGTLEKQAWKDADEGGEELSVKTWIESIDQGERPDALSEFDQKYWDGSIGAFEAYGTGPVKENVYCKGVQQLGRCHCGNSGT
ncbi:Uu.00g100120.m01.CDS01 [Anthostomella pinea]|uniref:Uu.00g100120.m01.CDS01 n=1 Tax=Anthostomella pinea TaxID=933095 RepID=A0AAI8VDL3_9PEZI|nr:Uu.00g100120.m01.CDS01 [Anthostomella pinea]